MIRDKRNVTGVEILDVELVFRGSAVALEPSGMPTVPNNLRSQTPDRSSTPGDNRRVRVSNWYTKNTQMETHWGDHFRLHLFLNKRFLRVCVFARSPTERRASPACGPSTVRPRKKPPAITGKIRTLRPSLCPGPRCPQVPTHTSDSCCCLTASQVAQIQTIAISRCVRVLRY